MPQDGEMRSGPISLYLFKIPRRRVGSGGNQTTKRRRRPDKRASQYIVDIETVR